MISTCMSHTSIQKHTSLFQPIITQLFRRDLRKRVLSPLSFILTIHTWAPLALSCLFIEIYQPTPPLSKFVTTLFLLIGISLSLLSFPPYYSIFTFPLTAQIQVSNCFSICHLIYPQQNKIVTWHGHHFLFLFFVIRFIDSLVVFYLTSRFKGIVWDVSSHQATISLSHLSLAFVVSWYFLDSLLTYLTFTGIAFSLLVAGLGG